MSATAPPLALIDSGPLLALFNHRDDWHERVKLWLHRHPGTALVTTWPVLTEVCALLVHRVGNEAARNVLRWVARGGVTLDAPAPTTLAEVLHAVERFADLPLDLADASLAEAAARLGIRHVLSIDRDFDVYRDRAGRALVNVLTR